MTDTPLACHELITLRERVADRATWYEDLVEAIHGDSVLETEVLARAEELRKTQRHIEWQLMNTRETSRGK